MKRFSLLGAAAAALALPLCAAASCGSAFCTINTNWDVQGAWQEPGARFDLRYEYIRQDQPMAGSHKVGIGEIARHHDEVLTRNANWLPSVDYTLDQDWGFNVQLPVVQREHRHIHNHMGAQVPESWDFTEVGDAKVLARRRLGSFEDSAALSSASYGVNFGLKLPTARTNIRNDEGELAERTLQPGTGTTDLLLGAYFSAQAPAKDLSWFAHALVQLPADSHDDFRPSKRLSLDAGLRYLAGAKTSLMLQANVLFRGRDGGAEAEPEDSGGKALFLSPGIGYALSDSTQVYAFVQLPLYQYVNGVQLAADRAIALGVSARF